LFKFDNLFLNPIELYLSIYIGVIVFQDIEETKGTIVSSFFYYAFFYICDSNIRIILGETFSLHSISTTIFPHGEEKWKGNSFSSNSDNLRREKRQAMGTKHYTEN
jgi:hypothetical protein